MIRLLFLFFDQWVTRCCYLYIPTVLAILLLGAEYGGEITLLFIALTSLWALVDMARDLVINYDFEYERV